MANFQDIDLKILVLISDVNIKNPDIAFTKFRFFTDQMSCVKFFSDIVPPYMRTENHGVLQTIYFKNGRESDIMVETY